MADPDTLVVFSGKSLEHVLQDGGSQSWKLDRNNARHCTYLVCCRSGVDWVEGPEPRGSAFLVGRISDVVPSTQPGSSRWLVKISEFARVDIPDVWQGWRNPVRYTDLQSLGINADTLAFEPMPEVVPREVPPATVKQSGAVIPLSIVEAKRGLALNFGVPPDAIEITIRG